MNTSVSSVYKNAGELIRAIVNESGRELLLDTASFAQRFEEKGGDRTVSRQLSLLVDAGNIKNYLPQNSTGLSLVDVNNIISCSEKATGLSRKTVKDLVSCVLYGLSMPTELETVALPAGGSYQFKDIALTSFEGAEEELKKIAEILERKDMEALAECSQKLEDLAGAGHPEALYLKGLCFYDGIGTEKNKQKALSCFVAATYSGHLKAQAKLGDYYSEQGYPLNTKAFGYYTSLGATALNEKRQRRVSIILNQKYANVRTLIGGGILFLLVLVFNVLLGAGSFSYDGSGHWLSAVFSILLSGGVFGVAVLSFIKYRYDSIKWMIPVMAVITCVFAMLAL